MHFAAADSFSAFAIFMRADWVVKLVMLGLALASLWSWAVIIDKLIRFNALNRAANRFEDQVASGKSLEDMAKQAGDAPRSRSSSASTGPTARAWTEAAQAASALWRTRSCG